MTLKTMTLSHSQRQVAQVLAAVVTVFMEGSGICRDLLSWGQLWRFMISALLFTIASGLVLMAYCIRTSPMEVVTFGYSYMPISAVLSYFAFNRRYGRLEWLSVGMLSLGVFAFVLLREESREGKELRFQMKGLLLVFASVCCSATGSILAERVFKERSWGDAKQDRFYIMKFHLDLTATFVAALLWALPLKRVVVFRDFMLRWEKSEDWFGNWGASQYIMVAVMVAHGWAAGLITREFSTVIRSVVQTLALLSTWLIGDPLQDNHLDFLQRCVPSWLLYLIVIMAALIFQTGRVNLKVIRKACDLSVEDSPRASSESTHTLSSSPGMRTPQFPTSTNHSPSIECRICAEADLAPPGCGAPGGVMPTFAAMYAGAQYGDGGEDVATPPRPGYGSNEPSSGERSSAMGSGHGTGGSGKGRGGVHYPEVFDIGSERGSNGGWSSASQDQGEWETRSWWSSSQGWHENWSWVDRRNDWSDDSHSGHRVYYDNWDWVKPHDPWHAWHRDRQGDPWGVSHRHDQGQGHSRDHSSCQRALDGDGDPVSPTSMPAARDVSGTLPSGEMTSAGQAKEHKVAGDQKHGKISSSYPPIFRAKPGESYKEWKRAVGFWLGGEAGTLPPELIGPRLMVQLRDRAGQLVHHLSNEDVNTAGGMELVLATLEKSPLIRQLDKHKVDLHRKRLMSLRRLPQESIESYVTRGQLYRTQLIALDDAMQMGECFFTGHLLDGARLSRKDKVMIKTRAGSDKEVDITNAMVELAPELEGEPGFPIGSSEPNVTARQGEEFLIQRPENSRYVKKEINAVEFEQFPEESMDFEDDASLALEEFDPPELVQAANEAFALQHKAKQRIMEVRKLRQYFRRPERGEPDERRRQLQERMKTSPCHRCGELGHWSRECPQRNNANAVTSNSKVASQAKSAEDDWATLVSLCHQSSSASASASGAYRERFVGVVNQVNTIPKGTFWCQQELHLHVIIDLGCVKSVVGLAWMNQLIKEWKLQNRWFVVEPESERFQFGNGETLNSKFKVQFECMVGGCHLMLGMSVVQGHCPPLLSRHACSQLGLKINCGNHTFSSTRMGIKMFGMSQASNGHYLLPISNFDDNNVTDIPKDFMLMSGQEAQVLNKCGAHQSSESSSAAVMFESVDDSAIRSEAPPLSTSLSASTASVHGPLFGERQSQGNIGEAAGLQDMRRSRSPHERMPDAG
eukprot:s1331_g34.t1